MLLTAVLSVSGYFLSFVALVFQISNATNALACLCVDEVIGPLFQTTVEVTFQ